jgi:hypothetical protein
MSCASSGVSMIMLSKRCLGVSRIAFLEAIDIAINGYPDYFTLRSTLLLSDRFNGFAFFFGQIDLRAFRGNLKVVYMSNVCDCLVIDKG